MIVQFKKLNKDERLLNKIFKTFVLGIHRGDCSWIVGAIFFVIIFYNPKYYRVCDKQILDAWNFSGYKDWNTPEEDAAWKNL